MKFSSTDPNSFFRIIVEDNNRNLIESASSYFETYLRRRLDHKESKPIGLATGRTMIPFYSSLVERLKNWTHNEFESLIKNWLSYNLDEYIGLPNSDKKSYHYYMNKHLIKPLGLNPSKVRLPNGNAEDVYNEADRYSNEIRSYGGFSIQLLGLGQNGHVGFNEPPCELNSYCRVVRLSHSTRMQNSFAFEQQASNVPLNAITIGIDEILNADQVHLIVSGRSKLNILRELLQAKSSKYLPASWIKSHPKCYLWADKNAFPKRL
tara:strand:- start:84 stop:875 length:792 start_codon:yes stop_codon:yes gene_type:complete